jgi:hypothetical protein
MTDVLEATPTLEAAVPVLEAAPAFGYVEPANPDHALEFELESYDGDIKVNVALIPDAVRMRLLKNATKAYITNRVSTAEAATKKANAPFVQYDAAMKNDPLQTLVPAPEGVRKTTDVFASIDAAIKALYSGEIGKRGGEKKAKVLRDPLITQITRAVVAEVYEKGRALDPQYKYPTAQKLVGQDGLAYLKDRIAEKVALGADEASLLKYLDTRYVKPARIQLGLDVPKSLAEMDGIL